MKHWLPLACALLPLAGPALAQYKVVGPDGSITYTDRPPTASGAKVTTLSRRGDAPAAADAALPLELRQVAARYPVTLYTMADCQPCEAGRQLLVQRGIPYAERRVATDDDAAALERVIGGRTLPSLTIGSQALRGLSQSDWAAYLDAAGYPRESKLPRNWQAPAPLPMVERAPVQTARPAAPLQAEVPLPASSPEGAIKF